MISDARCSTCLFFQPHANPSLSGMGYCHRNAPLPSPFSEKRAAPLASWPLVTKDDGWCGEHEEDESLGLRPLQ
jgi:hypothetical protein